MYDDLTYFQKIVVKIGSTYFVSRIISVNKIIANSGTSCVHISRSVPFAINRQDLKTQLNI